MNFRKQIFPRNLIISSFLIVVISITINCSAQSKVKEVDYRGNKFTFPSTMPMDTMIITDPITGEDVKLSRERVLPPDAMNGERIYRIDEVDTPPQDIPPNASLEAYLFMTLKNNPEIKNLPDCQVSFWVSYVVIDKMGKIIFPSFTDIRARRSGFADRTLNIQDSTIESWFLNAPTVKPATVNGNAVLLSKNVYLPYCFVHDHALHYRK